MIGSDFFVDIWFGSSPIPPLADISSTRDTLLIIRGSSMMETGKNLDPLYIIQYSLDQWYFFLGVSSYVRDSKLVLWFFELLPSPLVCCKLHRDIIQGGGGVIAHDSSKKKILSFYINHRGKLKFFLHSRFLLFTFITVAVGLMMMLLQQQRVFSDSQRSKTVCHVT